MNVVFRRVFEAPVGSLYGAHFRISLQSFCLFFPIDLICSDNSDIISCKGSYRRSLPCIELGVEKMSLLSLQVPNRAKAHRKVRRVFFRKYPTDLESPYKKIRRMLNEYAQ
jgi:hypothetical protein